MGRWWVGGRSVVGRWVGDGSVVGRSVGRWVGGGQSVDRVLTGDPASVCTTEKKDRQYTLLPFIGSQRVIRRYGMRCHLRGMDTPKLNAFSRMTMLCHGSTSSVKFAVGGVIAQVAHYLHFPWRSHVSPCAHVITRTSADDCTTEERWVILSSLG